MTKDKALKLALEALEQSQTKAPFGTDRVVYWQGVEIHEAAIAAVKDALAQPAQRPWVGLTDKERDAIEAATLDLHGVPKFFATAIEAKLKAVNGFHSTEKNT